MALERSSIWSRRIQPDLSWGNFSDSWAGPELEFDYLVGAGANVKQIALSFEGAEEIHASANGDLVLNTPAGAVQLHKPVAYQDRAGSRQLVDAHFAIEGETGAF